MANDSERIELRLPLEEKERWMQQAKEFGLTLSEWIRRCCSHHATPDQGGSGEDAARGQNGGSKTGESLASRGTRVYSGPRNVRTLCVPD